MEITIDLIDGFAWTAFGAIVNGVLQSAVLLGIALLSLYLLRSHLNAATRYLIWYVFVVGIVSLPFLFIGTAKYDRLLHKKITEPSASTNVGPQIVTALDISLPTGGESENHISAFNEHPYLISLPAPKILQKGWLAGLLGLWVLVFLWKLFRIAMSYFSLLRIKSRSTLLPDEHHIWFKQCALKMNSRRRVDLGSSSDIPMPIAAGFRNVMILIPEKLLGRVSQAEFEQIALHELAHIRRFDNWTNLGQKLIEAAFFFHPIVWWAGSRLDIEREIACDNGVISITGKPRSYAMCLTTLIESVGAFNVQSLSSSMFSKHPQVFERIRLLMDSRSNKTPGLSTLGASVAAVVMIGAIVFGSLTLPAIGFAKAEPDLSRVALAPDEIALESKALIPGILLSDRKFRRNLTQNAATTAPVVEDHEKPLQGRAEKVAANEVFQSNDPSRPSDDDLKYSEKMATLMRPRMQALEQKVFSEMGPEMRAIEQEAYRLSQPNQDLDPAAIERQQMRMQAFQNNAAAKMDPQVRKIEAELRHGLRYKKSGI
ncbi:MAG: M56 family metallopeptidase [Pyrinomonadaceae bacterium]